MNNKTYDAQLKKPASIFSHLNVEVNTSLKLVIIGAGQYGFVAKDIAEGTKQFSQIVFLDDKSEFAVGKLSDIDKVEYDFAFVAIGNPEVRRQAMEHIPGNKVVTLIHENAIVMSSAKIGVGSLIEAGSVISSNAEIGKGTIVMANAVVGHDARVGDYSQLKYGCIVPERESIPSGTKIDCNEVYRDKQAINEMNRRFVEEEVKLNGVEPGYF